MTERQKLWTKSRYLHSKMKEIAAMITGSIALRHIKRGESTCRCPRGCFHFIRQITYKRLSQLHQLDTLTYIYYYSKGVKHLLSPQRALIF